MDIEKIRMYTLESKGQKLKIILDEIHDKITKEALRGFNYVEIEMQEYPEEVANEIIKRLKEDGFSVAKKHFLMFDSLKKYVISW